MTRALELVTWLLRHQGLTHGTLRAPLVLVRHDPLLADAQGTVQAAGHPWQVATVAGPLSLRHALRQGERHVLVLAQGYSAPLDVSQRAWLRRPLVLGAREVVAAAAGRLCRELTDAGLLDRLRADLEGFFERAAQFSFADGLVSAAEVQQILAGHRRPLAKQPAAQRLAEWLREAELPVWRHPQAPLLRDAYPGDVGAWLAYALGPDEDGRQRASLVSAGMQAGAPQAYAAFVDALPDWPGGDSAKLQTLVREAWGLARAQAPDLAEVWLAPAEAAAADLPWQAAANLPTLRASLNTLQAHLADALAHGGLGEPDAWAAWADHDRADQRSPALEPLRALARFATDGSLPDALDGPNGWLARSRELAVADRLAREARRAAAGAEPAVRAAAQAVFAAYLERRDAQNAAFAKRLAAQELQAFRAGEARDGLSVHTVGTALVRPLLKAGHKVLLLVLDGCDQSTLLEVLDALPGVGPAPAPGPLAPAMPTGWITGLSPVPTLTSNGRRALFGGNLPNNSTLTSEEKAAADSSSDPAAFAKHPAWSDFPARLLLKGDLGPDAQQAVAALRGDAVKLLAVVFNTIDDSLSSKGVNALGPWDAAALGQGLIDTVQAALDGGWTVLVTADHGHTPHWAAARKVKLGRGSGQRYRVTDDATLDGHGQRFGKQPWRDAPLVALTHVGGYLSGQHVGYHGGAAIEEVCVPVVHLARKGRRPPPSAWFLDRDDRPPALTEVVDPALDPAPSPAPTEPAPPAPRLPAVELDRFSDLPGAVAQVYRLVDRHGVITEAQLNELLRSGPAVRRFKRNLDRHNAAAPFALRACGVQGKDFEKVPADD